MCRAMVRNIIYLYTKPIEIVKTIYLSRAWEILCFEIKDIGITLPWFSTGPNTTSKQNKTAG